MVHSADLTPMKSPLTVLSSLVAAGALTAAPAPITSTTAPYPKDAKTSIERLDPALNALIGSDAVVENLGSGFRWSEGPVWDPAQGALLFSDVPENRVYRWKDGAGLSVFLEPSGFTGTEYNGRERGSNGLTLDPQGRLTLARVPQGVSFAAWFVRVARVVVAKLLARRATPGPGLLPPNPHAQALRQRRQPEEAG